MQFEFVDPPKPDKYKLLHELIRQEMKRNIEDVKNYDADKDVLLAELLEEVKEIYKDLTHGSVS